MRKLFQKITVKTTAEYLALADSGKLIVGQWVRIAEEMQGQGERVVRYGGERIEGGSLTFWHSSKLSAQAFSATVKTMTRKSAPAPVVPADRGNKLIILRSAVAGIVKRGWQIGSASFAPSKDVDAIVARIAAAHLEMKLVVTDRHGRQIGAFEITDGRDHEIFKGRTLNLDDAFYEAFGLINEANDYGDITDWAA